VFEEGEESVGIFQQANQCLVLAGFFREAGLQKLKILFPESMKATAGNAVRMAFHRSLTSRIVRTCFKTKAGCRPLEDRKRNPDKPEISNSGKIEPC
jgi:hypothetical protein